MKYGIIDIGSNSVRLMINEGGLTLSKEIITTRLSEGLKSGKLKKEAMERTKNAIVELSEKAKKAGASCYCFGTEAIRSAENRTEFLDMIRSLGLEVDVIDGDTEAICGYLGVKQGKEGKIGVIDIGGASTEIVYGTDEKPQYKKSVKVGAVRIFEEAGREKEKIDNYIKEIINSYGKIDKDAKYYAVGGTGTSLGAYKKGLTEYDSKNVNNTKLELEEIKNMSEELLSLPTEEIIKKSCMDIKRAEVIGGGARLLYLLMKEYEIKEVTVSESDNLEGYLFLRNLK